MCAYHSRDDEKEIKSAFVPDTPTLMNQKALFKTYVLGKLVSTSFPSTCVHILSWHTYE